VSTPASVPRSATCGDLLAIIGWSTSQGDAALDGSHAAQLGDAVSACPWSPASTLHHPWTAGWVSASVDRVAPPSLANAPDRRGYEAAVYLAHGSAATLALRVYANQIDVSRPGG
jgi:hypothetical protein